MAIFTSSFHTFSPTLQTYPITLKLRTGLLVNCKSVNYSRQYISLASFNRDVISPTLLDNIVIT